MKRILILLIICTLVLTGCGRELFSDESSLEYEDYESTLFVIGYNFEGTNPLLYKNNVNKEIFSLIYDSLFKVEGDFSPVPVLSEDLQIVTSNGLNYRLDLKKNVTFHDGTELTATDVVATINYLLDNNTAYDYNVRNIAKVSKNTTYSVNITLKKPAINLKTQLTFPIVSAKDILKEFSFNGTGRFKVTSFVNKKHIDLRPNENYFGINNEEISGIRVQLMPDKETANYAYSSGMADIYNQDIFTNINMANPKSGVNSIEYLSTNYGFLMLNHNTPSLSSKNVRRAIELAIDKEAIVTDILFSHAVVCNTPVFPGAWCENNEISGEYNVEKAKEILKNEGFIPNVDTGILEKEDLKLSFSLLVNSDNNFRIQVANKISESLKYVGIDCKVSVVPFDEYSSRLHIDGYEALLGAVPMSEDFDFNKFMGENNPSGYYSKMAVDTFNEISLTDDMEGKKEGYLKLQKIFKEELPHISLYYTKESIQFSDKIKKGLTPNGINVYNGIENWSFKD